MRQAGGAERHGPGGELPCEDGRIGLDFRPFEIKTLCLAVRR